MPLSIPTMPIPQFLTVSPNVPDFDPIGVYQRSYENTMRNRIIDMYLREQEDKQNFMKMQAGYTPQDTQISIPQAPIMPPEISPQYPGIGDRGPNALLEQNTAPIEQPPLQYTIPGDPVNPAAADRYPVQAEAFRQAQQQKQQDEEAKALKAFYDITRSIPKDQWSKFLPEIAKVTSNPTLKALMRMDFSEMDQKGDALTNPRYAPDGTLLGYDVLVGDKHQFVKPGTDFDEWQRKQDYSNQLMLERITAASNLRKDETGQDYEDMWASPEDRKNAIEKYVLTKEKPLLGFGRYAVKNWTKFEADYNAYKREKGITPQIEATLQDMRKADSKAYTKLVGGINAIDAFTENAKNAHNIVRMILQEMRPNGQFQSYNNLKNLVKKEAGHPLIQALQQSMMTAGIEYGKAINSGIGGMSIAQPHVAVLERADKLLHSGQTIPQVMNSLNIMEQELDNTIRGPRDQAEKLLSRMNRSVDDYLSVLKPKGSDISKPAPKSNLPSPKSSKGKIYQENGKWVGSDGNRWVPLVIPPAGQKWVIGKDGAWILVEKNQRKQ